MKKCVLCDCNYNVMKQLTKKMQFLWNVDGYVKDAERKGDKECAAIFRKIKADEERHAEMLRKLLMKKAKEGKLD
jgi:rubrerythrin